MPDTNDCSASSFRLFVFPLNCDHSRTTASGPYRYCHPSSYLSGTRLSCGNYADTPLNDRGIAQSEATRDALAQTKIDIAYTSDLVRAKRTAEIIMEPHVGSPLIVDARIKEKVRLLYLVLFLGLIAASQSLGALEGTIYYKPHPPEAMKTIEPMQTFLGRLLDFFDSLFPPKGSGKTSILPESDQEQFTVLIVSHGGPIKVLLPSLWKQRNVVWTPEADSAGQAQKFKVGHTSRTPPRCIDVLWAGLELLSIDSSDGESRYRVRGQQRPDQRLDRNRHEVRLDLCSVGRADPDGCRAQLLRYQPPGELTQHTGQRRHRSRYGH